MNTGHGQGHCFVVDSSTGEIARRPEADHNRRVQDPQNYWLQKLRQLNPNISNAKGDGAARFAPHKPLLLLALLDLAEQAGPAGIGPRIALSADLRVRFLESWSIVVARWGTKPEIRLPFYHLSSQEFWKPLRTDGTASAAPESTAAIELHPGFAACLSVPGFRNLARHVLIQSWFPADEQLGLYALLDETPDGGATTAMLVEEAAKIAVATGRDARFRIQVVGQYVFTCALTGYALTAANSGATLVEAAHIADFATSRNNDPRNGLALTPDAHWSFDEHLWTIDENLRVVVARNAFSDSSPEGSSLARFHGRPLFFHAQSRLRPHEEFLARHRARFTI